MNVLIIGGTGLISTGIVKALGTLSANITVFNRGQTDNRLPPGIIQLHGDRHDFSAFEKSFVNTTFDAVIDMICFNPDQARSAIRAFAGRTRHYIFCSTVCTYGNTQTIIPTLESTPQHPHSDYGKNKVLCEELFLAAQQQNRLNVTIMRPSHTFGPGGGVINNTGWNSDFVDRLRKGKPVIVSGDGHGLWQSAFSEDVGFGFAHACLNPATFGESYNIVGHEIMTWDQYTQRTAAAIGAPVPNIVHIPTDALLTLNPKRYASGLSDIFRYHGVYSNAKIHRDVPQYTQRTTFEDATRATVAWLDKHEKIANSDDDATEDQIIARYQKCLTP